MHRLLFALLLCLWTFKLDAQLQFQFSGNIDVELHKGGKDSHYYLNGIHKKRLGWRFRPLEMNLFGKISWGDQWSLSTRFQLERSYGYAFEMFRVSQLSLNWLAKDIPLKISLGRFINPFGSYNQRQISVLRNFVDVPLAYAYYTNISSFFGYTPGLGNEESVFIFMRPYWGAPISYYNGYANGLKVKYVFEDSKWVGQLAISNGAPIQTNTWNFTPLNYAITGRLFWQVDYFWKQGFSFSYGTFRQDHPINEALEDRFQQLLLGTDFKLGFGFWEFSGEILWASHHVPFYQAGEEVYFDEREYLNLSNWSAYLDIRYEFPFMYGAYVAGRFDTIQFSALDEVSYANRDWDDDIWRLSLVFGVQPQSYLLLKVAYSYQEIENQTLDLCTFRTSLTAFF